jgi:hypothetical protein
MEESVSMFELSSLIISTQADEYYIFIIREEDQEINTLRGYSNASAYIFRVDAVMSAATASLSRGTG